MPLVASSSGLLVFAYTVEPGDAPANHYDLIDYGTEIAVMLCFLFVAGSVVTTLGRSI